MVSTEECIVCCSIHYIMYAHTYSMGAQDVFVSFTLNVLPQIHLFNLCVSNFTTSSQPLSYVRMYVCGCHLTPCYPYPTGDGHSTFVRSLAEQVLSVDLFLKPKYTFSGILADHVSVGTMLQVRPHLPLEIMDVMSYQNLAPHVSRKYDMHT